MTQEQTHTPEPWDLRGPWKIMYDKSIQDAYGEEVLTVLHEYQNSAWDESAAARIVACVNACAGMQDPAAEIAALRARVAELEKEATDANG